MSSVSRRSGVYQILNRTTGDLYVGSSLTIGQRWTTHRRQLNLGTHPNPHLQNAWTKYGAEAFEFSVLEFTEPGCIVEREQHWIDTLKPVYNAVTVAGWGPICTGRTLSDEHKAKIGRAGKGRPHSDEHKRKIGEANKGKQRSPEFRQYLSACQKGRKVSDEVRARRRELAAQRGYAVPPESAVKAGATRRARNDERYGGKCSRGHPWTPETTFYQPTPKGAMVRRCLLCRKESNREHSRRRDARLKEERHARGPKVWDRSAAATKAAATVRAREGARRAAECCNGHKRNLLNTRYTVRADGSLRRDCLICRWEYHMRHYPNSNLPRPPE